MLTRKLNCVFLHIPRTGGSSLWHGLARAALEDDVPAHDLYDIAIRHFDGPEGCFDAVRALRPFTKPVNLFHHHTPQNVLPLLPPGEIRIATVLRDPLERLRSEIVNTRSVIFSDAMGTKHREQVVNCWPDDLRTLMLDPMSSEESLLLAAVRHDIYKHFYLQFFFHFFYWPAALAFSDKDRHAKATDLIEHIAVRVRKSFHVIGIFPDLNGCYRDIRRAFGLSGPKELELHINGMPARPTLDVVVERELRAALSDDYDLYSLITATT